jgi:pimeloyl-ACP methyl ester carboxylesterase
MKNIFLILLAGYLLLILLMYLFQRQMLYFPSIQPPDSAYQVLTIDSGGLKIKVLVDNPEHEQAVLYFGGNGENVYEGAKRMQSAFTHRAAYYMNYPGYGGSSGAPTESTIIRAAKDVYAHIKQRHPVIALVGRSLGTGVVATLASEYKVSHLILISPYDSMVELAFNHYPIFPASFLLKDKFDSASRAQGITGKVLIILAAEDKIIPLKHSQRFIEALKNGQSDKLFDQRVKVQVYEDADHNNLHLHPGFMHQISDFLRE